MGWLYLSVQTLHVVAVISWMAGLLYLPRLMVYHADAAPGGEASTTFKVMERRLLKAIMGPAMIVTWITGLTLAGLGGWFGQPAGAVAWLWVKIALVLALTVSHGVMAGHVKRFADDANEKPARYFRVLNEAPTVLLIGIVACVVLWKGL